MIETVDRNEDWKISYSEFRVNVLFSYLQVYVFSIIEQKNNFSVLNFIAHKLKSYF